MADEDEDWTGPITEASPPLADRVETLEAGEPPEPVIPADAPIEERVARLERIAEYLHDARRESAGLTHSVDLLAEATQSLTRRLTAIEDQQRSQNDYERSRDGGPGRG